MSLIEAAQVGQFGDKVREARLSWFRCVEERYWVLFTFSHKSLFFYRQQNKTQL